MKKKHRPHRRSPVATNILVAFGILVSPMFARGASPPVDFSQDVLPILKAHCVSCHGPARSKGGLRLDDLGFLAKGGASGSAVIAGKPGESLLAKAITHQDGVSAMPPEGRPQLTNEELQRLLTWIAELNPEVLAKSERPTSPSASHWAFQPVRKPVVPPVKQGL